MRAPLSWLREYVDLPAGTHATDLASRLTALGLKLEALEAPGADIEGPLVDWKKKGHVVELVGRESIAGAETDKLKVLLRDGVVRYDYVDVASRMVVRSDVSRLVQGRRTELQSTFSDFRKVSGIVFPHHIEIRLKDRPQVLKIAVEKIELDPDLDPSSFRMPS